jgi:hypothetical protein
MVGFAFLVCFGATMLMRIAFWLRKKEIVQLLNNYIQFENTYFPGGPIFLNIFKAKLIFFAHLNFQNASQDTKVTKCQGL